MTLDDKYYIPNRKRFNPKLSALRNSYFKCQTSTN